MRSRTAAVTAVLAASVVAAVALGGASPSGAEVLCTYQKLTGTDLDRAQPIFYDAGPAVSGDGELVVFQSSSNLDGLNPDNNEELWSVDAATGQLTRLTDSTFPFDSVDPAVDRDGDRIAFVSTGDLAGDNDDLSPEVFLLDGGTITQVTDVTGSGTFGPPTIDGDGERIAFSTTYDLDGSNPEGNHEVFLHEVGGSTTAITDEVAGDSLTPDLSDDGAELAFSSLMDAGGNADGNREIYLHTVGGTTIQVTSTTGFADESNRSPALDADGSVLAFSARPELAVVPSPGTAPQVVVTTVGSGIFEEVSTHVSSDDPAPSINGDGTTVAFTAQQNPLGTNADITSELWFHDLVADDTRQLTTTAGASAIRSVDLDLVGRAPVFISFGNLGGINPTPVTSQVFRHPCSGPSQTFTDVPTTHPFFDEVGWMAAARISTGFQPGPTYKPDASVTRAAMSAFMFRLADSPFFVAPGAPTFSDVPTNHPFFREVEWMAAEGITTGFPGGLYKPADAVTRQSMSAFMFRLAGSPAFTPPGSPSFGDVPTSHPFFDEIEWMADEGITTGFPGGLYKPADAVTRQAMSAFMYRLADGPGVDLG